MTTVYVKISLYETLFGLLKKREDLQLKVLIPFYLIYSIISK